jgi:hypothetical protein
MEPIVIARAGEYLITGKLARGRPLRRFTSDVFEVLVIAKDLWLEPTCVEVTVRKWRVTKEFPEGAYFDLQAAPVTEKRLSVGEMFALFRRGSVR